MKKDEKAHLICIKKYFQEKYRHYIKGRKRVFDKEYACILSFTTYYVIHVLLSITLLHMKIQNTSLY